MATVDVARRVLDVALETGFENHETFTRAFRARFGATPSAFRKSRGATLPRSTALHFPSHYTLIMPKKKSETPITSATHRLSLEIARPHAAVWKAFAGDIHSWWPKDFYVTESPQRIVFELKPGGRLYEHAGNGNGLIWYHVIALDVPNSITLSGFIAPPFGGPATSLLNVSFTAKGKSATAMEVTDAIFGCLGDTRATAEGWRLLFEGGFKRWIEQSR